MSRLPILPAVFQSLHASVMWQLQRRFHLYVANVGVHPFAAAAWRAKRSNPRIAVRFLGREEVLSFCGDPSLGLHSQDVSARFDEGEMLVASMDGEVLAGYDWYRAKPVRLEQGAIHFQFEETLICNAYSFTHPNYRGRLLSADRWDF